MLAAKLHKCVIMPIAYTKNVFVIVNTDVSNGCICVNKSDNFVKCPRLLC